MSRPKLVTGAVLGGPRYHLSEDSAVLTLGREVLSFRGEIQQSILRQLVDAFHAGRRLRTAEVLAHAGSNEDTLKKAFRGNPSWPKLKRVLRWENGFCWIESESGSAPR